MVLFMIYKLPSITTLHMSWRCYKMEVVTNGCMENQFEGTKTVHFVYKIQHGITDLNVAMHVHV